MLFLTHHFTKNDQRFIEDARTPGVDVIGQSRALGEVTEHLTIVYHVICEDFTRPDQSPSPILGNPYHKYPRQNLVRRDVDRLVLRKRLDLAVQAIAQAKAKLPNKRRKTILHVSRSFSFIYCYKHPYLPCVSQDARYYDSFEE